MTKRKDSEVYLAVAEEIAAGYFDTPGGGTEGACDVLSHIQLSGSARRPDLREEFQDYFVRQDGYHLMDNVCASHEEAAQVRVLALCFMAAIAKSEGR